MKSSNTCLPCVRAEWCLHTIISLPSCNTLRRATISRVAVKPRGYHSDVSPAFVSISAPGAASGTDSAAMTPSSSSPKS